MANDTFRGIASKLLLRCPTATLTLSLDWVQSSFRDIVERRRWSWLLKKGQLVTYNAYTTGTVTVALGATEVFLTTGVVSADFIGRQFRIGTALPIMTITDINVGANSFTIDQPWMPVASTAVTYTIYKAYPTLPTDFHAFLTVIDPAQAVPIPFDASVAQLDRRDPQRVVAGSPPACLAYLDYFNGLPRYELWPHQTSAAVYPIVYESRPIDTYDSGATVPALLPSDIILERALMYCAAWPGPSTQNPNPYSSKELIALHRGEFERRIAAIERQDNEHMQQNVWYQNEQIGGGGGMSGSWMQSHAL